MAGRVSVSVANRDGRRSWTASARDLPTASVSPRVLYPENRSVPAVSSGLVPAAGPWASRPYAFAPAQTARLRR